jgi:hypothetical protein
MGRLFRVTKAVASDRMTLRVTATLLALDSASFLAAVSGHAPTRRRAEDLAVGWAGRDPRSAG